MAFRLAVGLQYNGVEAPLVTLKGADDLADQAVKLARRFAVPVVCRPELARGLHCLEVDKEIPEALYEAVAVVLNEIESKKG